MQFDHTFPLKILLAITIKLPKKDYQTKFLINQNLTLQVQLLHLAKKNLAKQYTNLGRIIK